MSNIYLDNNATTALDPRVLEEMLDCAPANPSAIHHFGREARNKLTRARRRIAERLDVRPSEIVFTSGGTEALNLVLSNFKGPALTSTTEHVAVLSCLDNPTCLAPGDWGAIRPEQLEAALDSKTRLIALMAANNETGVKSDLEGIARVARAHDIPLVVDGVALLGKELFAIPDGVTAICFSAHKFHGPKGVGFAVVRNRKLSPLITGGSQEQGLRGGTENLLGILGMAKAVEIEEYPCASLRDRLEREICKLYPKAEINGSGPRVANTTNIAFCGLDGEALLMQLDMAGIAVSHGSACSSGSLEPSRVLLGMGYSRDRARSSIRFSLSRYTTEVEISTALGTIAAILPQSP